VVVEAQHKIFLHLKLLAQVVQVAVVEAEHLLVLLVLLVQQILEAVAEVGRIHPKVTAVMVAQGLSLFATNQQPKKVLVELLPQVAGITTIRSHQAGHTQHELHRQRPNLSSLPD
jgi:hypothetical protein